MYRRWNVWPCSAFGLLIIALASPARAQFTNENLRQVLPKGFKVGFQTTRGVMTMTEAVPEQETVQDWSEMVTTQVFLGKKDVDPSQFLSGIGRQWLAACSGSVAPDIHSGNANGYAVSMFLLQCPMNPATAKPESTLFRAIKGADSFYLVQYAFRSIATQDQINAAANYLGTVNVCDTRTSDHPCIDMKGFSPQ